MRLLRRTLTLLLLVVVSCFCLSACKVLPDLQEYIDLSHIDDAYTPDDAKRDGCVVFENAQLTSGAEEWDIFLKNTLLETPAMVRLIRYQDGELMSAVDLQYSGVHYLASQMDGSETVAFEILKHYTVNHEEQVIDAYVLLNDEDVDNGEMADYIAENLYSNNYSSSRFLIYAALTEQAEE